MNRNILINLGYPGVIPHTTSTPWIVPHVLILSNQIAGIYLLRYRTYHRRHVVITSVKLKQ